MIRSDAETMLREFAQTAFPKKIHQINERISCYVGYGHSNCVVIEGDTSLILVDTLDSDVRAARLREIVEAQTMKQVKTIIYTHGHPDHRGGAVAFQDSVAEIIAFSPRRPVLKYTGDIADVLNARAIKQFGHTLNDEELIVQGVGIREGHACGEGQYRILPPTTIYHEDTVERVIDGVALKLVSAVGESDDQLFVWLPEDKVLCCGDNYYACWPNLYAIRGGQYRDIAAWVDSLENILSYPAEALLPGHTNPILGYPQIQEVVGTYKEAIKYVLLQTLDCIRQGMTENETVQAVKLPHEFEAKPYLGEFYGTVAWSVRAIYQGYLGWFDGNPTNLNPLPDHLYATKMIELIGGADKVLEAVGRGLQNEEYQWAVQLCDLLIAATYRTVDVRALKANGLMELARLMTSANGRHYYIAAANELVK